MLAAGQCGRVFGGHSVVLRAAIPSSACRRHPGLAVPVVATANPGLSLRRLRLEPHIDSKAVSASLRSPGFSYANRISRQDVLHFGRNVQAAKRLLREADAVCFDVDSTVVVTEGIDVLARCYGVEEAVANLTKSAMDGNTKFEDALASRLQLIQPTRQSLLRCVQEEGRPLFSSGVRSLVAMLHERGTHVYLVSGGFRVMIEPVAEELGIPKTRIFANTIRFNDEGRYADFDPDEPTSRDGGKAAVLRSLARDHSYKTMIMIGDGATDLQARPPAKAFIGYGGVVARQRVMEGADWFVRDFGDLVDTLSV